MTLALSIFALGYLLEFGLYVPLIWQRTRRPLAAAALLAIAAGSGLVLVNRPALATVMVVLVGCYRIFNLLRIVAGRQTGRHLYQVAARTSRQLLLYHGVIGLIWWLSYYWRISAWSGWLLVAGLQFGLALYWAVGISRHIRRTVAPRPVAAVASRDLPSISVCVPARNETAAMETCLRRLVASTYPKLEILVLDDQSHDRTPEIIRGFAHDGVRFIKGNQPPAGWLAKNWAYQRLLDEASGEIVVFSGVDVQLSPDSLRELVTQLRADGLAMLSVMPVNVVNRSPARTSVLLQPLRYAWELSQATPFSRRPPVLSSCWLAERSFLGAAGGFGAVARSITPESHFATAAGAGYRFIRSSDQQAVSSQKSWRDQWDTAVRTRYPQLHRRPEAVWLLSVGELVLGIAPYPLCVAALLTGQLAIAVLSGLALIMASLSYARIVNLTYGRRLWRGLLALPQALLLDIYVRHYSMWHYEFGSVVWKGRDVTAPVMHVVPHLPYLP